MFRDWERNFTSNLRETEENLSRMRNHLDPARYKPIDTSVIDSPPDYKSSNGFSATRQSSNRRERPVSALYASSLPSYELYRHSTPSTGLVALLSEKVERQNKAIEQLSRQVNDLENDRRKNEVRVRELEHQVNDLTARLAGQDGHRDSDRNLEGSQRDIRNQLDELHERITKHMMNGMDSYNDDGALTSLTREFHEIKRALHSECDALHRDIETVRSRLVKQEMDTTGQMVDTKELGRRVDRLDGKVTKLTSESQLSQSLQLGLSAGTYQSHSVGTQKDIRDLKTEMSKMLTTFSKLESASQVSHNSHRSVPSTVSISTISSNNSSRLQRRHPSGPSVKGAPTSSPWQRTKHHQKLVSSGSSTSLDDLSSSEVSLPLSIGHQHEDREKRASPEEVGRSDQIDDDAGDIDDFSLSLSDLEGSQRDGEFGSAGSLDSDQLDLDLL